ncbi:hypothetical protein T265_15563, partial [Opisthorchis viverrini]
YCFLPDAVSRKTFHCVRTSRFSLNQCIYIYIDTSEAHFAINMFKVRFAGYVLLLVGFTQPSREQTTDAQRQKLLKYHNDLRDKIRSCQLPGQPPVKGPYEPMVWDSDVEAQAQRWADNCKFAHGELEGVGQNAAVASNLELAVKLWVDEYMNYNYSSGSCKPMTECLHYTQMAWATSTKLGCGVKHCPENRTTLYVCDYKPPGNYLGQKPYTAGTEDDCLKSTTSPPPTSPPANPPTGRLSENAETVGKPELESARNKGSTTGSTSVGRNLWQAREMAAAKLIFSLTGCFLSMISISK